MDPATLTVALDLASQGMRIWADFADRAAKGEVTQADLDLMTASVQSHTAALQALVDAKKTAP